jgi:type IV pilus assembly protein PilY1
VNYVLGVDQSGYRGRTVTIDGATHVWKLGDIIDSTPRAQTTSPINSYHLSPPTGYSDTSYNTFVNTSDYRSRGMVYVGANDGMLHAINAGTLLEKWSGQGTSEKAWLSGANLGKEAWAFVPKNVLPYLTYLKDTNYCHLYYVDAPSLLVDASIGGSAGDARPGNGSTWRTVLIGGSGLGGACNAATTCSGNCVQSPISSAGLSSYFAIDVTDPNSPTLLWEFSDEHLGFATSGPAVVRVGAGSTNGKWYVVFASGPTGPIDTGYHQFMGKSNQTLKLFILDLKTGTPVQFSSKNYLDTNIADAFGGSIYNAVLDAERGDSLNSGNYQDDVVYIGYTKKCTGTESPWVGCTTGSWNDGGVVRLLTKQNTDASTWDWSSVMSGIGPVTTSVTKLQDRKGSKLWLYFGTGRFFYKNGATLDDQDLQRRLFGVREKASCFLNNHFVPTGCSAIAGSTLDDRSTLITTTASATGWYVNLDVTTSVTSERVITDPLATFSGNVFFTTFAPSSDPCSMGGNTFLWALKYDSGGTPTLPGGKALIQVSTGEIKQVKLSDTYNQRGNRRSTSIWGVPPKGQGLSILASPRPTRRIMHIQEK